MSTEVGDLLGQTVGDTTQINTNSYNQAIIGAINLGNDTDTVGACVGGLAGICYGLDAINKNWLNDLIKYDYIFDMCNKYNGVLNNEIKD